MRPLILACLASVACAHAYRCPERGGPSWIEASSAHFVMNTNLPEDAARQKLASLERLRAGMALFWSARSQAPEPLPLFVPRDAQEMEEFSRGAPFAGRTSFGEHFLAVAGTADFGSLEPVKLAVAADLDGLWLLDQVPWASVGLVHYLAGTRIDESRVILGEPSLIALRFLREQRGPSPVSWFMGDQPERGEVERATPWLLVHYLFDHRRAEFARFLGRLASGDGESQAITASFGRLDAKELDLALEAYYRAGELGRLTMPLPAVDEGVEVRPLTEAELHAWRADALASSPDFSIAAPTVRAERDEALRHDPTEPRALSGQRGSHDERLRRVRAAVTARPGDWRTWFLLWAELADLGVDDFDAFIFRRELPKDVVSPELDDALEQAARRAPRTAVPHFFLSSWRLSHGKPAEALEEALIAVRLAPLWPLALDTYAAALARTGHCEEARRVQQRALFYVGDLPGLGTGRYVRDRLAEYERGCPQR